MRDQRKTAEEIYGHTVGQLNAALAMNDELVAMLERCQNVLCMSEVFDLDRDVADLLKRAKGD